VDRLRRRWSSRRVRRITANGSSAVELGSWAGVNIRFPGRVPDHAKREASLKVFIVHGHDEATKNEVALFLSSIGLEPIILHLRPNGGRGLLTKFREESDGASFAVVLMTPDDEGGPISITERKARARQNVVFELGFFIGQLGPSKVAALIKDDVESPSDFQGIAYTKFDSGGRWKTELARELHHANVPFDLAKGLSA
jgi:predicted nucleotide-binding protein